MIRTWDKKCDELADHFLQDYRTIPGYPMLRDELASEIQCSIEDWLNNHHDELKGIQPF